MADSFPRRSFGKSAGLTLVELMIALAVAAILAQIALPEFSDILKNNRSTSRINELQTSLLYARSEAIKRNTPVVLCKSSNGTGCQDSGENWHSGWLVFEDANGNDAVDGGETVLSLHGNVAEQFTLTFTPARIVYTGDGLATEGLDGTFTLCDDRGAEYAKGLIIGPGGRPRLAVDTDSNGVLEDADGSDLECS